MRGVAGFLRCASFAVCAVVLLSTERLVAQASVPKLPAAGSVFVAQSNGEPERIRATELKVDPHVGRNFAIGGIAGPESTVEVQGVTSDVVLKDNQPTFYVRLWSELPEKSHKQAAIVKLKVNDKTRTVCTFSANIFGAHHKRHEDVIPVLKTDVEADVLMQMSLSKPLDPGEYALVFLPDSPDQGPSTVYAFTIAGK